MTKYICKCGRVVQKSTNADNTGNRDTASCEGCPYLLPWGPMVWDEHQKAYTQDVKGQECRMSPTIEYTTTYHGRSDDKCSLHIVSLDLDFLDEVQAWIYDHANETLRADFSRGSMRGIEFSDKGRYSLSVLCAQNKKGVAAKAALLAEFFGPDKRRLDMTPEEEKAHILAAIEAGKARAQKKEDKTLTYKDPATGWLYRVSPKPVNGEDMYGMEYLDPKNSTVWKPDVKWNTDAVYRDQGHLQEALEARARRDGWEPVEENVWKKNAKDAQRVGAAVTTETSATANDVASPAIVTQTSAEKSPAPASHADAGSATQSLSAAEPASLEADECTENPTSSAAATAAAEETVADDVCPYLELIENSKKYSCQCSICGDRFVNTEICNKTFLSCGWYLDQQDKDALNHSEENTDKDNCLCRTCGSEECPGRGCNKECPNGSEGSCFTATCPGYIERTDIICKDKATNAPSAAAAATSDGSAAAKCGVPDAETRTTPADASGAQLPQPLAQTAPRQTEHATDTAPAAPFDYSGLDAQTVEVLHVAEHEILTARQTYICRVSAAVAAAHEAVVANCDNSKHGNRGEHAFINWCASVGLKKDAAYRLLQVNTLLTGATPEEQATLEAASPSLLYAAAKPSAPEELVQAVKDGDITTHKQYQEALAEIRAKDAKIQELMEVSKDAARQADEARAWAKKAEQEAALDRKEREDAHEKAMHYKAECDRRAQEQQRVEGLLSTREEQLREACKQRDGARDALQAAKLRGDQWQEKAEARQARIQELESRPIQTTAMDSDEVDRLVAQRMEEELAKQTPRRQEEQEQAARDAYDAFILTARSLPNLWKALKPQISRLAPEQKTGAENLLLQKLMEVKEELIHACENCQP